MDLGVAVLWQEQELKQLALQSLVRGPDATRCLQAEPSDVEVTLMGSIVDWAWYSDSGASLRCFLRILPAGSKDGRGPAYYIYIYIYINTSTLYYRLYTYTLYDMF